jgi:cilia- and flagella-associated protein 52
MGNFITIENINDPHDQKFLRAHDMPVTVLAVSPSGELLASGQVGTTRYKGNAAPVFVWSTVTGRRMTALRGDIDPSLSRLTIPGITQRVNLLQFSTDEKFLCGCGDVSLPSALSSL